MIRLKVAEKKQPIQLASSQINVCFKNKKPFRMKKNRKIASNTLSIEERNQRTKWILPPHKNKHTIMRYLRMFRMFLLRWTTQPLVGMDLSAAMTTTITPMCHRYEISSLKPRLLCVCEKAWTAWARARTRSAVGAAAAAACSPACLSSFVHAISRFCYVCDYLKTLRAVIHFVRIRLLLLVFGWILWFKFIHIDSCRTCIYACCRDYVCTFFCRSRLFFWHYVRLVVFLSSCII